LCDYCDGPDEENTGFHPFPSLCQIIYISSMINEKYPHSELTSRIIGCAMEVHNVLGNGF
jgi:hypothetical protein